MGLIKAAAGAVGGVLADMWKDFFICESMPADVLVTKGQKRAGKRSSNTSGEDNIITDGSVVAVAEGQCMIIMEQGQAVDICAEPGEYTYDKSSEPSIFGGDLANDLAAVFSQIGRRFTFGGDTGKDQRVYFVNTKEIMGNKYGTPSPVPFKLEEKNLGISQWINIRCFGEYSYRIANPLLFFKNVCGNVSDTYKRDAIDGQLKTELMTALQPTFAKISAMGISYDELPAHSYDIAETLNGVLSKKWRELRGIEIVSFGVSSVNVSDEDKEVLKRIQTMQTDRALMNPTMAAAHTVGASAEAMKIAAGNTGGMGAAMGFMGMNMASNAGLPNAANLFAMGAQQQPAPSPQQPAAPSGWTCECGHGGNTGKFCAECGKPRPAGEWTCECGAKNSGKFCQNCGKPRPAGEWICQCGAKNSGKFCQNCGKPRS